MEKRELTCICCPLGCQITVTLDNGTVTDVTGNSCERGKIYAQKEVTNPTRIVTSTMKVIDGDKPFVSVKTKSDIPKGEIFHVMKEINAGVVKGHHAIGDVAIANVCDTGVDVVITKNV